MIGYPTLLEFPSPRLLAYPKETVIAEKFEVLVKLGIANTRMKDFYDLEILSRRFAFEGKTLAQAIQNTFQKRGTDLPIAGLPVAFTSEFMTTWTRNGNGPRFARRTSPTQAESPTSGLLTQLLRQRDAKVFKKYSQMKLQMKREALEKMNRQAHEMLLDSGTATIQ
jgi:Nucleotidyl transferase AbiEii toxin, Type IV TA system